MQNTKKKRISVFAFDLGNTLVNDARLAKEAVADMSRWMAGESHVPEERNFVDIYEKVNREATRPFISHTYGEIDFFEDTFRQLPVGTLSAEEGLRKYREILMEKIRTDRHIVETFQLLKERGIRIALLSNESVLRVDAYMKKTGMAPFFDAIIVSEGVGVEKPDPGFFELALERLKISGEEMVMFGDNVIADGACKKLGITFVLVNAYRNQTWIWEKGDTFEPDYVMERIGKKEMRDFLSAIDA